MNTNPIEELPQKIIRLLEKANLQYAKQILTTPRYTMKKLGATDDEIDLIFKYFARQSCPDFIAADKWTETWPSKSKRISFGCDSLNEVTNNGVTTQGITEIYGEAGSGKSQITLQLALMVQLPEKFGGLGKGAVYICTEDRFPSKRLCDMVKAFERKHLDLHIKYNDNIFIHHCAESEDLLNCLQIPLDRLMKTNHIGLIVIDSIAAIFRNESNYKQRAKNLKKIARQLLNFSSLYNCAIVCINQVACQLDPTKPYYEKLVPCLGLIWSNLVNTRIQIHRTNDKILDDENGPNKILLIVREMEIIQSVELPHQIGRFLIDSNGLNVVNENNIFN